MAVRPTSPSIGGGFRADSGSPGNSQAERVHRGQGVGSWGLRGASTAARTPRMQVKLPLPQDAHGQPFPTTLIS